MSAKVNPVIGHLVVCDFFVEGPTVMSKQGIGLDVLSVGPGALVGLVTFLVVYTDLQHKQLFTTSGDPPFSSPVALPVWTRSSYSTL